MTFGICFSLQQRYWEEDGWFDGAMAQSPVIITEDEQEEDEEEDSEQEEEKDDEAGDFEEDSCQVTAQVSGNHVAHLNEKHICILFAGDK